MDDTCADGSFYLVYTANGSDSSAGQQLDYTDLPDVYSADGGNVSRDLFETTKGVEFCDDPCQPASGGSTCSALSCYEVYKIVQLSVGFIIFRRFFFRGGS